MMPNIVHALRPRRHVDVVAILSGGYFSARMLLFVGMQTIEDDDLLCNSEASLTDVQKRLFVAAVMVNRNTFVIQVNRI